MRAKLLLLAASAALSACGTLNQGLESVHQPVVQRTDYVYDMAAPDGDQVSPGDEVRLNDWFASLNLRYGDRVSVDTAGQGTRGRDAVAQIAARYGLLTDVTPPVTQGQIAPGAIRVIVSRTAATVPNCPDFSRPSSPEFAGSAPSNYGCASNTNLASMVADPRDLIAGRAAPSTVDVRSSTKAISTYRAMVPTGVNGLKTETTRGGN